MAQLETGPDLLHPNVRLALGFDLGPGTRSRLTRRLLAFARDLAETLVAPLRVRAASQLTPAGRGIVYQLEQNLGTIHVENAWEQLQLLTSRDRQLLTSFGVHVGDQLAYLLRSLTPAAITERAALVSARNSLHAKFKDIPLGAASIKFCDGTQSPWLVCVGYANMGPIAVRADHYEFVRKELTRLAKGRRLTFPQHIALRLGCSAEQLELALRFLGYFLISPGRYARRRHRPDPKPSPGLNHRVIWASNVGHSRMVRRISE